jgi:hypothetical protein
VGEIILVLLGIYSKYLCVWVDVCEKRKLKGLIKEGNIVEVMEY